MSGVLFDSVLHFVDAPRVRGLLKVFVQPDLGFSMVTASCHSHFVDKKSGSKKHESEA